MTVKLTPSQERAIEQHKKACRFFHNAEWTVWQPKNTSIVRLVAEFDHLTALGTFRRESRSWMVGKRGKITDKPKRPRTR